MSTIVSALLYQYHIPLARQLPVATQRIDCREGLVLVLDIMSSTTESSSVDDDALAAAFDRTQVITRVEVEIAPLSGNDINGQALVGFSRESLDDVSHYLQTLLPELCGADTLELVEQSLICPYPSAAFGLSLLHAKYHGLADAGRRQHDVVPLIYKTESSDAQAEHELQAQITNIPTSATRVKVKLSADNGSDNIKLVYAILAKHPNIKLRLDANRSMTLADAIDFAACLPLESVEYIEEPCQNPADNPKFSQAIGMPYALDESLHDPQYPFSLPSALYNQSEITSLTIPSGLSALVIKPMLLGSLTALTQLIDTAHSYGLRCILSSSLESSLGLADLAVLATRLTPDEAPGLDTLKAFSQDLLVSTGKPSRLVLDDLQLVKRVSIQG